MVNFSWGGVLFLSVLLLYVKYVEEISNVVVSTKYAVHELLSQNPKELLLEAKPFDNPESKAWHNYRFTAHAGGDIEGLKYTNSQEAISHSISEGFSIINVDISQTSDGYFVCMHDWSDNAGVDMPISLSQLNNQLIYDSFHYCTLQDLLTIMQTNDIWVILDAKCPKDSDSFSKFYHSLSNAISQYDPSLFDHFIVEVYSAETYEAVFLMNYPYQYIYFPTSTNSREIYQNALFCLNNGIDSMLLDSAVDDEVITLLSDKGFKLFIYNINTIYDAREKATCGAWGFQTDYLSPKWSKYIFDS